MYVAQPLPRGDDVSDNDTDFDAENIATDTLGGSLRASTSSEVVHSPLFAPRPAPVGSPLRTRSVSPCSGLASKQSLNPSRSSSPAPRSAAPDTLSRQDVVASSPHPTTPQPLNIFDAGANRRRLAARVGGPRAPFSPHGDSPHPDAMASSHVTALHDPRTDDPRTINNEFERMLASNPDVGPRARAELLALDHDRKAALLLDIQQRASAKQLFGSVPRSHYSHPHNNNNNNHHQQQHQTPIARGTNILPGLSNVDVRGKRSVSNSPPRQANSKSRSPSPSRASSNILDRINSSSSIEYSSNNNNNSPRTGGRSNSPLRQSTTRVANALAEELAARGGHLPGRASLARDSRFNSRTQSMLGDVYNHSSRPNMTSTLDDKFNKILDHAGVSPEARIALSKLDVSRKIDIIDQYYVQKDLSRERHVARLENSWGQRPISVDDLGLSSSSSTRSRSQSSVAVAPPIGPRDMSTATLELQKRAEELGVERMFNKLLDGLNIFGGSRDVMIKLSTAHKKEFLDKYFYIKDQLEGGHSRAPSSVPSSKDGLPTENGTFEAAMPQNQAASLKSNGSIASVPAGMSKMMSNAAGLGVIRESSQTESMSALVDEKGVDIGDAGRHSIAAPEYVANSIPGSVANSRAVSRQASISSRNEQAVSNSKLAETSAKMNASTSSAVPPAMMSKTVSGIKKNGLSRLASKRSVYDILVEEQFGTNIAPTIENVKLIRSERYSHVMTVNGTPFTNKKPKPKSPERLDSLDPSIVIQRGGLETPLRYVALVGNKNTPMKILHRHLTAFRVAISIFGPEFGDAYISAFIPYMGDNGINGLDAMMIALRRIAEFRNIKLAMLDKDTNEHQEHLTMKPLPNLPPSMYSKQGKTGSLKSMFRKSFFGGGTSTSSIDSLRKNDPLARNPTYARKSSNLYADSVLEDELALEAVMCIKEIMKTEAGYNAVIKNGVLICELTAFLFSPVVTAMEHMDNNMIFRPSTVWGPSSISMFSLHDQKVLERQSVSRTAAATLRRNQNRRAVKANLDLRIHVIEILGPISVLSSQGHIAVMASIFEICGNDSNRFGYLVHCLLDPFIHPDRTALHNIYVSDDEDYMKKVWEFRIAIMVLINSLVVSTTDINDRLKLRRLWEANGIMQVIEMLRSIFPPVSLLVQFDTFMNDRDEDSNLTEDTFRRRNEILMSLGQICSEFSPKMRSLKRPQMAENRIRNMMMYISCILDSMPRSEENLGDVSMVGAVSGLSTPADGTITNPAYIESDVVGNDVLHLLDRIMKTTSLWCTSTAESGNSNDPNAVGDMYRKLSDSIVKCIEDITGQPVRTSKKRGADGSANVGEVYEELNETRLLHRQAVAQNEMLKRDIEALKVELFRERHVLNHVTRGRMHSASSLTEEEYKNISIEQRRRIQRALRDSDKLNELLSKMKDYNLISQDDGTKPVPISNEDVSKKLNAILVQVGLLNEVSQKMDGLHISIKDTELNTDESEKSKLPSPSRLLKTIRKIKSPAMIKAAAAKEAAAKEAASKEAEAKETVSIPKVVAKEPIPKDTSKAVNKGNVVTVKAEVKNVQDTAVIPPPPPPPPPPAIGISANVKFTETRTGKKVLQANAPMKNLQWEKISNSTAKMTIWNDISENAYENGPEQVIDGALLDQLFGKEEVKKDDAASSYQGDVTTDAGVIVETKDDVKSIRGGYVASIKPRSGRVTLLEHKRAQNIEIVLGVIRKPFEEIRNAIISLNEDVLTLDNLENLLVCVPTPDECELVRSYNLSADEEFGNAEAFIASVMDIPRLTHRLNAMIFYKSFGIEVSEVVPDIKIVMDACKELVESRRLKRMLQHVLVLGNYLNGGSFRGGARGFRLAALLSLKETRPANAGPLEIQTLLHYLVRKLKATDPEALCFMDDMPKVDIATRISVRTLFASIKGLRERCDNLEREVKECKARYDADLAAAPSEEIKAELKGRKDPFIKLMDDFHPIADEKIKEIEALAASAELELQKTIELYGESIRDYGDNLEDFFSIFSTYALSVAKANSENEALDTRRQRAAERAASSGRTRDSSTTTSTSSSADGPISHLLDRMLSSVRSSVAPSEASDVDSDTSSEWSDRETSPDLEAENELTENISYSKPGPISRNIVMQAIAGDSGKAVDYTSSSSSSSSTSLKE